MKTLICVPCMDTIQTEFVQSLVNLHHVGSVKHNFISCSLVYKSRNDLAMIAIEEKPDYVLWLDSDMVFPSDLLVDLIHDMDGRDIVSAVYHMRRPPYKPVLYKKLRLGLHVDENESEDYTDYPKDGIFKIEGSGFGCVMMRTEVLESVINKYHDAFGPLPGYGEDLSFCIRARGCGYDMWCDPKLQLGHKATTIVTDQTFDAYRKAGGML